MVDSGVSFGIIYGLEFQCRSLCAVAGDTENVSFLVGTQGQKITNQVHQVTLDEETRTLSKKVFQHLEGEIWEVASCHSNEKLLSTKHSKIDSNAIGVLKVGGSVWTVPENSLDPLQLVCHVKNNQMETVDHISWTPSSSSGEGCRAIVLSGNMLALHDVNVVKGIDDERCSTIISTAQLDGKHSHDKLSTGAWNPHQNFHQYATANEHQVRGWDLRSMAQAWLLETPSHCGMIRSIDFNHNKQYALVTGGDDGAVRFWDIRQTKSPIALRSDHSHWIWSVKYNQFHDQLLLSSSSDGRVVLSCMASLSSESLGHLDDEDPETSVPPLEDGIIQTYDDHEDSVYVVDWSASDPWTFASLSFDGRLVINQVPKGVKFKILNLA